MAKFDEVFDGVMNRDEKWRHPDWPRDVYFAHGATGAIGIVRPGGLFVHERIAIPEIASDRWERYEPGMTLRQAIRASAGRRNIARRDRQIELAFFTEADLDATDWKVVG